MRQILLVELLQRQILFLLVQELLKINFNFAHRFLVGNACMFFTWATASISISFTLNFIKWIAFRLQLAKVLFHLLE